MSGIVEALQALRLRQAAWPQASAVGNSDQWSGRDQKARFAFHCGEPVFFSRWSNSFRNGRERKPLAVLGTGIEALKLAALR
jgi:hypothetical protein